MSLGTASVIRLPAVAGLFYSADPQSLARDVAQFLSDVARPARRPKALIVPHAGYRYSGAVAAHAYAQLAGVAADVRRVVLLGPSHRVPLRGMALPSASSFQTPLGNVALDRDCIQRVARDPQADISDAPHAQDHALEVQLPFLQSQLGEFQLVPIAVGQCAPACVARVLSDVWGGDETLIVVSTDLSHFQTYAQATATDRATCEAILRCDTTLNGHQACGCYALNGLLAAIAARGMRVELLDRRNSGDVTGDRARVVGYASFAAYED